MEDYLRPFRRRSAHRLRPIRPRSEPEKPLFLLSTLPFLVLLLATILLAAAVMVIAWPPSQPALVPPPPVDVHELGTAPKGWFQQAEKQFHRK